MNKRRSPMPIWLQKFIVLGWITWVTKTLIQLQVQIGKFVSSDSTVAEGEPSPAPTAEPLFTPKHEQPLIASPLFPLPPPAADFREEVMRGDDKK